MALVTPTFRSVTSLKGLGQIWTFVSSAVASRNSSIMVVVLSSSRVSPSNNPQTALAAVATILNPTMVLPAENVPALAVLLVTVRVLMGLDELPTDPPCEETSADATPAQARRRTPTKLHRTRFMLPPLERRASSARLRFRATHTACPA